MITEDEKFEYLTKLKFIEKLSDDPLIVELAIIIRKLVHLAGEREEIGFNAQTTKKDS